MCEDTDDPRALPGSAEEERPLEVDQDNADADSTIDERISSYTATLTSSVLNYPEEHGRRYHAYRPGSYFAPNDEDESDRLDFTHALIRKTLDEELYLAPLQKEKVHRILDIGTGTGIWAIEMGDEFDHAEVIGNDLSAIQPEWTPPNVKFEIDDVESPWLHPSKFDFIFSRYLAGSIGDWPKLVRNVYDNLNPGGWAEFQDYDFLFKSDDGSYKEEHHTWQWNTQFIDATVLVMLAKVRAELKAGTFHSYGNFHVVYGQKA
ncbi:hypothetical protein CGMCC3_g7027 [Colletotrichum fructicola]|nr:uncharacterized protein CGMCC3_g7027 [Colletotrichum fructicola]KAE9576688.1 hypothetical protein CGMCC3_g7027 [Colletotrichum fructicola]